MKYRRLRDVENNFHFHKMDPTKVKSYSWIREEDEEMNDSEWNWNLHV